MSYYAGTFLGGVLLGFSTFVFDWSIEGYSDIALSLMCIPFGLLTVVGLYWIFKKTWSSKKEFVDERVIDEFTV